MTKQKEFGQYMTPKKIVTIILNNIGYIDETIFDKKIMEPSFGDGAFLTQIVEQIILKGKKQNISNKNIAATLQSNVFGIEKDEELYNETIVKLNKMLDKYNLPQINWTKHLLCGDTLLLYHKFENTFDYVVGNPPFVRIHNISMEDRNLLKEFQFTNGMIDLYVLFYEIGIKMLNNTGKLGFITPNSFLKNMSQKQFRNYLIENKYLSKLYDFKTSKIFPNANTYTCICILDKNHTDLVDYKEYDMYNIVNEYIFSSHKLLNKEWHFCNESETNFLEENSKCLKKLGNIATIQNGIVTNKDEIFIHKIFTDQNLSIPYKDNNAANVYFKDKNGTIVKIESTILKHCVKESKYNGNIDNTYIIYPYKNSHPLTEQELKNIYPKTYQYLFSHYQELMNRDIDKKNEWYLFGRSQGLKNSEKKKIIFKHIIEKKNPTIIPYILNEDVIVYSGIYTTANNENDFNKIKEIYESKNFAKYCSLVGKDMNGGYVSISTKMIKEYGINK